MNIKSETMLRRTLRIALSLTVICICVALAVSVSYTLTRDKIEEKRIATERAAISAVFEVSSASGDILGWAVSVSPSGFGGNIDMIVGIGHDGKIVGVNITALSETPGLGSRVNDANYLSQYIGISGKPALGTDVDAISGATISSRSVLSGVNRALAAVVGMELVPAE